ncbi:uncharacterized protein LOC132264283 [Phlebotomus argentipes]|uniref:uncharacterized protein LOC132264283 n=1 Tax=Phlebotomus argentipes TaxID=94469 RepID=UPI0028934261|nr:uncharacterized protein LOC132264283 [Phlebotomus argentipes]
MVSRLFSQNTMNFHDSIKSLAAHLAKIDENTYTDEDILLEDSRNLCNSLDGLGNNEHTLDDPSAAELFIKLHQMLDFCCKDSNGLNQFLGILKELGNNPKIRKHLQKMDFISLLANCLLNREMEENSEILCVLNKLTKGFRMETPEICCVNSSVKLQFFVL